MKTGFFVFVILMVGCVKAIPSYLPPSDPFEEQNPVYQVAYQSIHPILTRFAETGHLKMSKEQTADYLAAKKSIETLTRKGHIPSGYLLGLMQTGFFEGFNRSLKIKSYLQAWQTMAKAEGLSWSHFKRAQAKENEEGIEILKLVASYGYHPAQKQLAHLKIDPPIKQFQTPAELKAEISGLERRLEQQDQAQSISAALIAGASAFNKAERPSQLPREGQTDVLKVQTSRCSYDLECGLGKRCIKTGLSSFGQCGQLVDSFGLPANDAQRKTMKCTVDLDCGLGFKCLKLDAISGVCAR